MTEDRSALFVGELDAARQEDLLASPDWPGRLQRAVAAARTTSSEIGLSEAALLRAMGQCFRQASCSAVEWFEHLHPEELALACGCATGLATAVERFRRQYASDIEAAVRRFARPGLPADDLRQLLMTKLFVAAPGDAPRIASYTGQGFLQNWLRVTAMRTFVDATRAADQDTETSDDDLIGRVAAPGATPELELARRQSAAHFRAAVAEAVKALDRGQRLLLKQHVVGRLSIDQLASLHAVHRATAARRVLAAREALVRHARHALAQRLRIDDTQLDSLIGLLESRLEASVARLLDE